MKNTPYITKLLLCLVISYLPLLLQAQCPDPNASNPTGFSCNAIAVNIQEKLPTTGTGLLTSGWTHHNAEGGSALTNDWRVGFNGGNDACGLPTHSIAPNVGPVIWPRLGISDSITNPFPTGNKENAQQDGWLLIPISYDCIDFRLGGEGKAEASALYAGTSCDNMTLVGENNTLVTGLTNDFSYTLPSGLPIVSAPSCDYFLIRIRLYHNDPGNDESNSEVAWNVGRGFEIITTNYLLPVSDHNANDMIPASIGEEDGASLAGLYDEYEQLWELPADCSKAPTTKINIPYVCYAVAENTTVVCNPCAIEMQEVGCICDNTENSFGSTSPWSVTAYQQTLLVTSPVDAAYTISNESGLLSGPTLVNNTNPDVVEYTYTVNPSVAYSFSLTGTTSGVTVVHSGACPIADDCNCPAKEEICGDNLDNDFDGAVDAADSDIAGNCALDCAAIPVQVQGKIPVVDGKVLTQIWSETCGNFCCTGLANTQQSPVGIAATVGGAATNGSRPLIIPFTTTNSTGTGYDAATLPAHRSGTAGCVLEWNALGMEEPLLADKMSRGRGDQVQMDTWIILPPSISCVDLRINKPNAHDGAALFLGPSINDMDFVGAAWGLQGNYTYDAALDGSNTQTKTSFRYDATLDGVALTTPDPSCPDCGFYVVRARWYGSDVSTWMDAGVEWNYGNGWENIPVANLQSVGTTTADASTDNNKPNTLKNGVAFCVYQDDDGDLFTPEGNPYALNKRNCEHFLLQSNELECFTCPPRLSACLEDCVEELVSASGIPADTFPTCFLEVFNLTPKTIVETGGLYTQFWDGNDGKGFNRQFTNGSITTAFDEFSNDATCPNCLPQHPNNPTSSFQSTTLGVDDGVLASEDTDGDIYEPALANFNGGENIQQDGWLFIPSNVSCIEFKLGGGGAYDASRLYLGSELDSMRFIGENINVKGANDYTILSYEVPASAAIIDESCDNFLLPLRAVRLRFYHHDNGARSNTVVQWNVGRDFVTIPATHLRSVTDECDQTLPSIPTYTDGVVTKVVRDERGRFYTYEDFPTEQPQNGNYEAAALEIKRFDTEDCYELSPICGNGKEAIDDPKAICSTCRKPLPSIADPCICLENGGVGVGQFAETVMVTGPSDQTWYIKSVTGLTQAPAGAFPPEKGTLYPITPFQTGVSGIKLTETKQASGISFYTLPGLHIDNIGYTITVSDGTTDLSISNKCTGCDKHTALTNSSYIESCGETFADDGSNDGNYTDTIGQKTYTFCPDNPAKQSIRLQFRSFEIATGDTFRVYTGNHIYSNNYLEFTGKAVSTMKVKQGVGAAIPEGAAGWVDATCNNISGCLTIRWAPNGDNINGAGWTIYTECIDQTPTMEPCSIEDYTVSCEQGKLKIGKIKAPAITLQNVCSRDTVYYLEYEVDGKNTIRDSITIDSLCIDTLGLGAHALSVRLKFQGLDGIRGTADDSTCVEHTCFFAVRPPNLPVCNDSISVPLGAVCRVSITPDELLEKPDTIDNHYQIKITLDHSEKTEEGIVNNETDEVSLTKIGSYSYTITDACDLSCNGKIIVFDNSPPVFLEVSKDTLIACVVDLTETGLGVVKPKVIDNCDTLTASFVKAAYIREGGICDTNIVQVTWEATDESGNLATLAQEVIIIRPDAQKIIKQSDVILSCGEDSAESVNDFEKTGLPTIQTGRIRNGQFLSLDTITLSLNEYVCGYILREETVSLQGEICGEKNFRYWELLDECTDNSPIKIDTQNISLIDTLAPTFLPLDMSITEIVLDPFNCWYDGLNLEKPMATDNCFENPIVQLDSIFQIKEGVSIALEKSDYDSLTCDTFIIKWVANDACIGQTKTAELYQKIVIVDKTPPTVQLDGEIQLSLTGEQTILSAKELDDGSFDACGIAKYEIRIKDAGQMWDSITHISCSYLSTDLQLELRVTDIKGNINTGSILVNTADKIDPICALDNVSLTCDIYHRGQYGAVTDVNNNGQTNAGDYLPLKDSLLAFYNEAFGYPDCRDNQIINDTCGNLFIEQAYFLNEGECGQLFIKRRARAIDAFGNKSFWATQTIEVNAVADWTIHLPGDWEGTCGEVAPPPSILIEQGLCDKMASEVTERTFEVQGEACFKIERTYHIINWCQYNTDNLATPITRQENEKQFAEAQVLSPTEALSDKGYFTYVQILKIHDSEGPTISIQSPDSCISGIEFDAEPFGKADVTPLFPPYECDEIKVWRATAIDCSDTTAFTWTGKLFDIEGNELLSVDTNVISYPVYNVDAYQVSFRVTDGCGNSTNLNSGITTFRDCVKPVPYLRNGIGVELSEQKNIEVWASDLDQNSFDNCSPQNQLRTRIWHASLGEQTDTSVSGILALPSVINFSCADLGRQTVLVYIIDEADNWDYAETFVEVQDNQTLCGNSSTSQHLVSGKIRNDKGETLEGVTIKVSGPNNYEMTVGADGLYQFALNEIGTYQIRPEKTTNPLNGVSTFDLVIISQHILGLKPFDTHYQYIAADVNRSGAVTSFDMVQLRRTILGLNQEFPNNTSWRFVDSNYSFISNNPADEPFNEYMEIELPTEQLNYDFIGVKIGDVNGSAKINSLIKSSERQAGDSCPINIQDRKVDKGTEIIVDFTSRELNQLLGYQFALNFKDLEFISLENSRPEYFNLEKAATGLITTSWNGEPTNKNRLFSLQFKVAKTAWLSELLTINEEVLAAEVYAKGAQQLTPTLAFHQVKSNKFKLYQNQPNPFNGKTQIAFDLPKATRAALKIMDIQGRVIMELQDDFSAGQQQFIINAKNLGQTGVLYYELTAGDFVEIRKMVVLE